MIGGGGRLANARPEIVVLGAWQGPDVFKTAGYTAKLLSGKGHFLIAGIAPASPQ